MLEPIDSDSRVFMCFCFVLLPLLFLGAEVVLHVLILTKVHCDGTVRGHQLLQWLCGQRNYCVTFKSPYKVTQRSVAHSQ